MDTSLDRLVLEHPLSARVLARHGVEFCCGGDRALGQACRLASADAAVVLAELREELERAASPTDAWDDAPIPELIDHILTAYHAPLREELPRLEKLARRVCLLHRAEDPARLDELLRRVRALKSDLEQHLPKEEQELFPALRAGHGRELVAPLRALQQEDEAVDAHLARLRELTHGYRAPDAKCNSRLALYAGLRALEEDLRRHHALEHDVLHRRVFAG